MLELEPRSWTLVEALRRQAEQNGDAIYCRFSDGASCTFGELDLASDACATGLGRRGIGPGDRVMIIAGNSMEFLVTFFGVQKRRAVLVPANAELRGSMLTHQISNAGPKLIIADRDLTDDLVSQDLSKLVGIIGLENAASDRLGIATESFSDLCIEVDRMAILQPEPRDICAILYTSGTSGSSKGVRIPQAHAYLFGLQQARALSVTKADCFLISLPMFHVNALLMSLGGCLLTGAEAYITKRFSASRWIADVQASGATVTNTLGVMAEFVLRQPETAQDRQHRLRRVMAVPVSAQWADAFKARFGIELVQVYGMTECNIVSFTTADSELVAGCVGSVSSEFFDVAIVDPETDEPLEPNKVGEIVVRPRLPFCFMQGYHGIPETTVQAWRNLWFHTGDAGRLDEFDKLHFVDRMGDCIRRRGENISSFEIEQVLLAHPEIAECAVVGIKVDGAGGEDEVCAYLVSRKHALDLPGFLEWCAGRLPRYAVPRFLCNTEEIEKTPTGKVKKRALRDRGLAPDIWDREMAGYKLERDEGRTTRSPGRFAATSEQNRG
jgi:crotonobetaine/carnitine-CoA ligase